MARTGTPHHSILERLLQRAMHLVAYVFDGRVVSDDEGFREVGFVAFSVEYLASLSLFAPSRGFVYLYACSKVD